MQSRQGLLYATVARPSVRLSDYPLSHSHAAAAGLLSLAGWPGDIDRLLHGRRSAARRAAANADSIYSVVSQGTRLSTDLLLLAQPNSALAETETRCRVSQLDDAVAS